MSEISTTSIKEVVIEAIRQLPDDVSVEEILEALYVRQKIETGLRQHTNGETVPTELRGNFDTEFLEEIRQRAEAVRNGTAAGRPLDEVMAELKDGSRESPGSP